MLPHLSNRKTALARRGRFTRPRMAANATSSRRIRPSARCPLFLDLGRLPGAITQVVELGPTHVALGHDFDLADDGRVDRKGALDADTEAQLAHRERLPHTRPLPTDDVALEDLDALAVALHDSDVDLEVVARGEIGDVVPQTLAVDDIGGVHGAVRSSGA